MRLIDADLIQYEPMLSAKGNGMYEDVMVAYKSQIDGLPTIEERKKGKWEEKTIRNDVVIDEWQSARCPVCKKYHTTPYMYFFQDYNYCPTCGARMVNDEDRAD